jgi:hypothetical protein
MTPPAGLLAPALLARAAAPAAPRQVDVPLRFDYEFIRQAVLAQLYTSPSGKAVVWDDGTGCGYLKLREPNLNGAGNRVRLVTRGEARVGTPVGEQCLAPLQWDGFIEVFEEPEIAPDQQALRFRNVQSNIYDARWKKGLVTGKLWDLVKAHVHPRLEAVRIEVDPAVASIRDVLPLLVTRSDAARIEQMLDSLQLAGAAAGDAGVTVALSLAVSPVAPAVAPAPEPTLAPEELRRWEEAWQRWDAFLTFVIKQFGADASTADLRQALGDVLIDARFDILEALAPSTPGVPDPTPALFLRTWERLAPVARNVAGTVPGAVGLRYMSFIAAADALAALDQAGPEVGLDISADGLRRLARIVAPLSTEDPLVYSSAVDPDLRQLLGFGPALPPPDLPAEAEEAWWRGFFAPRRVLAAGEAPPAKTLERWIAERETIDAYLQAVREVLDDVTKQALAGSNLEERYRDVYRRLILATAWQESCWRQFVRERAQVTYIKSPVGSTGMMQVNEKVWRGLYDLRGLRWDVRYNGRAGADIAMHYLRDYAVARKEETQPGGLDNLARAAYAAYNGGPGHLTRYRKPTKNKELRKIDDLFLQKYQAVSAGKEMDVSRCIVGG